MKKLLYTLLMVSYLFSQELIFDDLLKDYQDSESLYKKTKKESAGYLLIYSREDLERMQAFRLLDVLKTVRMYTLQIQSIGMTRMQKVGGGKASLPPIQLYIDNFEVTTVAQGNILDMYGDMDIYFVDHIEIYQGGSSIAFGNTPGSMVIRLYSKDPSRENSRSAQLSIDTKSSGNLRAIDAGSMGEYEYLLYADGSKTNFDKFTKNNQEISRDSKRFQAHFKIGKKDDFEVVVDGISTTTDIFNGLGSAPLGDDGKREYTYINATKFFDGGIKLSVSSSLEVKQLSNSDAKGIPQPNGTMTNNINLNVHSNNYKIILDKKITQDKHDLLIGAQFQRNILSVHSYQGINIKQNTGPTELDIYMLYLEDLYNINENHLLTFSAKLDYYRNSFSKNSTEYAVRLGYIALISQNWKSKLFAIRRYVYPNMLETTSTPPVYKPNPALDAATVDMLTGELEYNNDKHRVVFGYAYKVIDNALIFSKTKKQYINKKDTIYFSRIYVRAEHKFDLDNKIIIEYFKGYKDSYFSPGSGVLVQSFNKVGIVDVYNELVYRQGYTLNYGGGDVKIANGYDYTLALSYEINKNVKLKAKGENLLNKASKTLIDTQGLVQVPAIERRAILTMEYTF